MLYQLESMQEENKDKIDDTEKAAIQTLIDEGTTLKNNPETTKEQFDTESTKYQEEIMKLYQKF